MTPCERNGISGTCGVGCYALREGDCEDEEMIDMWENYDETIGEEVRDHV